MLASGAFDSDAPIFSSRALSRRSPNGASLNSRAITCGSTLRSLFAMYFSEHEARRLQRTIARQKRRLFSQRKTIVPLEVTEPQPRTAHRASRIAHGAFGLTRLSDGAAVLGRVKA